MSLVIIEFIIDLTLPYVSVLPAMSQRSLRASAAGIDAAKTALFAKALTQKSLVDEYQIASWSTINKFFRGKPVDRRIFLEICAALDLEWEDIAASQVRNSQPPTTASALPAEIDWGDRTARVAAANCEALQTRILEPISRTIATDKLLPAIRWGLSGKQRIIPIVAPAGFGKTTLLGELYVSLRQEASWLALVLCNTLLLDIRSSSELARALGVAACGEEVDIRDLTNILVAQKGRGILLLDTLDLVASRRFVDLLAPLLRHLVQNGVTVVFTCRDREYGDFFEPPRERLPGLSETIDRYHVPPFTPQEVKAAATAFVRQQSIQLAGGNESFADRVLALSADNRSLREIVCNPLLLALLCELFAKDGNVPPDLTVSKLYARYWQEKVAATRVEDKKYAVQLASDKERLCLQLASTIFQLSQQYLCESLYQDELDIDFDERRSAALNDLLSEGVWERLPNRQLRFFHQTLLEYAIAYWLTRQTASSQREQFLSTLLPSDATQGKQTTVPPHLWTILRQFLSLVDAAEFDRVVDRLYLEKLEVFRAVTFAAVARENLPSLQKQLQFALDQGDIYQQILQNALASAPISLAEATCSLLISLLEKADRKSASAITHTLGSSLFATANQFPQFLAQAHQAIATRPSEHQKNLYAFLLVAAKDNQHRMTNSSVLQVLRTYYHSYGNFTKIAVLQWHQAANVPDSDRLALLQVLAAQPFPKRLQSELKEALTEFLATTIPICLAESTTSPWQTWHEALHVPLQAGAELVQPKAVGRQAARIPHLLHEILVDLISGNERRTHTNLLALREAIAWGDGPILAKEISQLPIDTLPSVETCSSFAGMVRELAGFLETANRQLLATWCLPLARRQPEVWFAALVAATDAHSPIANHIEPIWQQLSPQQKGKCAIPELLHLFPQTIDQLPPDNPRSQFVLIEFYKQRGTETDLQRLLDLCFARQKKVALAAADTLDKIGSDRFSPIQLIDLLRSPQAGIRTNAMQLLKTRADIQESDLSAVARYLHNEKEPQILRHFCHLLSKYVAQHQQVPDSLPEAIERMLYNAGRPIDSAIASPLVDILNLLLQQQTWPEPLSICSWISQLLHHSDMRRLDESKAIFYWELQAGCIPNF